MFKKLKDKIAEEVKQSPLKSVQQLAQAVVSPTSSSVFEPSSGNDKFCIEEGDIEDEKQEQVKPGGFTSVTLTGQTTTPVRDQTQRYGLRSSSGSFMAEADNLFPKFEPQPTNFHVQSDWESASEVEDRYSQLDHITKESLYEAYRKVYNRYNKIKNKYHEVVTHYRQLEREKEKARTVLTETQDKALMRISELREQCLLEQQAKAHLEEALRNELEERDHIINTLKTKVQYLKGVSDNSTSEGLGTSRLSKEEGNLIDFTENLSVSKVPLPFDASISEDKINWFEEKLKSCKNLLNEETVKIELLKSKLKETINQSSQDNDANLEEIRDNELLPNSKTEKELNKKLSDLVYKLIVEVNSLQQNAVNCSLLKSVNYEVNSEQEIVENSIEQLKCYPEKLDATSECLNAQGDCSKSDLYSKVHSDDDEKHVDEFCSGEISRYVASVRALEDQNTSLTDRLQRETSSVKELKNEINALNAVIDLLKTKIKLSNENFGKNDVTSCLVADLDNELIREWNVCYNNLLIMKNENSTLTYMREDLEKELLKVKDEKNKSESLSKEMEDERNKLKDEIQTLQISIKSYVIQLETLSDELNSLKVTNKKIESQNKTLEESLALSVKVSNEQQNALQKHSLDYSVEKNAAEAKISSLESELENAKSEYLLLLDTMEKLKAEVLSLRKENNDFITEKEALHNQLNELENKFKNVKEDYNSILYTRGTLDDKINSLTKKNEDLSAERSVLLSKISNLETDVENVRRDYIVLLEEKEKLSQENICIMEKYAITDKEKCEIAEKYNDAVKECENNKQGYLKSADSMCQLFNEKCQLELEIENLNNKIEICNINLLATEEAKHMLSNELALLIKERDDLITENQSIKNKIGNLESDLKTVHNELFLFKNENAELTGEKNKMLQEIRRLEESLKSNEDSCLSSTEVNNKLCEDLSSVKKERDEIIEEKCIMENKIKNLEDKLTTCENEFSNLSSESNEMSKKVEFLKNSLRVKEDEYNKLKEECKILQDRYNTIFSDFENNKKCSTSLTDSKIKLSDELDSLKKDYKTRLESLNKTTAELEKQQSICKELEDQVCSVSETLKNKCVEVTKKCEENMSLKTAVETLTQQVNDSKSLSQELKIEKDCLLNYLIGNLKNVKIIKELQKDLCDFVMQFQAEISHEINDINLRMGSDLLKHLNDLLDPSTCGSKILDSECRSKKDIDSYNSKLKYLQGGSNNSEEILKVKATDLDSANNFDKEINAKVGKLKKKEQTVHKSTEVDDYIPFDENICDTDVYLKQAISLMKSFTNLLNHNSVNSDCILSDVFEPVSNEKYIRLSEKESKKVDKEIAAMEAFITEYETRYNEEMSLKGFHHKLKEREINASDNGNSCEIQLRQEIKLKDDIIKKLQSAIEEFEQKSDGDIKGTEKIYTLEQEYQSLQHKLQQLQQTHEANVKKIISEYEQRLEEMEEDKNAQLYAIEKLGKEKNFLVNELKEQIQNLQQDLDERGDAFEKLYEEHQQSMKSLDEEIHQLRANQDKELREQDKKWRQCLDRRLAEEEARHQQELASLNMQWNSERRELETARRLAVNAVESGSGSNELLRRQVQMLTMQLTELRENRGETSDNLKQKGGGREFKPKSVQDCTELEYLRNILYEYMMGKEPLVLAKVLCALMKFDESQTKEIVSKEEHKITLFGQLGLL